MRFYKFLLSIPLFCLSFSIFAATYPPDIDTILKRGTLIVALTKQDMPPFYMQDAKGRLTGLEIDLVKDVAQKLGVTAQFDRRAATFDEVTEEVAQNKADIAGGLILTLPRALSVS